MTSSANLAERMAAPAQPSPALDIDGVAAMGMANWRQGYAWPVSDAEFNGLAAAMSDAYFDAIATLNGREQDLLKADNGITAFLLQHFHLSIAAARLQHASSGLPREAHVAAHLTPDWTALGNAFAASERGGARLDARARALAKAWLLNDAVSLPARVSACFGRSKAWALGSRSSLRAAYQAQHGIACRFVTADDFRPVSGAPLDERLGRVVRAAVEKICTAVRRLHPVSVDAETIGGVWHKRLAELNALMGAVERLDRVPEQLLVTNIGLPVNRAVGLAMRRRGAEIVGFHHGNDMGAQTYPAGNIVELLTVDRFVVPSDACLRWRLRAYADSRVPQVQSVTFERVASTEYGEWVKAAQKHPLPQTTRSVMIIGYPPNWIRYADLAGHWSLAQLDLEIALIETLSAVGFTVLYKAHPEWEAQLKNLFAGLDCEFVGGHVEDCWQRADAFVFPRTTSTSFGFALCTNRPVVLLDMAGQNWIDEAYALLARRCRMVPATVDAGTRIRFDAKAMIAALKRPAGEPDRAYVGQAMDA